MKYVNITDEAVVLTLKCAKHYGSLRCIRERAHGLLLSNRGFTLEQIAEILEIKYQTASQWIDDWEDYGIRALYKRHDMVDNASIHTSKKFRARIADWILEKKLLVCFLPTYSPELNLIEILWRKVKYEWLNLLSIKSFTEFEKEVKRVFASFGDGYMISFANNN